MVKSLDTRAELTEAVQSIVSFIERPREADIVTRRYGIKGEQETLEQVGETMHITRERVRQIEKATMIRIKLWLEKGSCQAFNVAEMNIIKIMAAAFFSNLFHFQITCLGISHPYILPYAKVKKVIILRNIGYAVDRKSVV